MTPAEARDEILSAFFLPWKAGSAAIAGTSSWVDVQFDDEEAQEPPEDSRAFARITVLHADGERRAFGGDGTGLYRNGGTVIVQCFGPRDGKGSAIALRLATLARDCFKRETPNGVRFTRPRVKDVGPDKSWWNTNAVADFSYDEVQ